MEFPKTIEQMKEWYRQKGYPPQETTRFFIGINYTEPRAFGIYEENGEFIVYKNKNDGSRSIRYRGPDEAYAVKELCLRLMQEADNQRAHGHNVSAPGLKSRQSQIDYKRLSLFIGLIPISLVMVILLIRNCPWLLLVLAGVVAAFFAIRFVLKSPEMRKLLRNGFLAVAAIAAVIAFYTHMTGVWNFSRGMAQVKAGDYVQAESCFSRIGYLGALRKERLYQAAMERMAEDRYGEALILLEYTDGWRDTAQKKLQCRQNANGMYFEVDGTVYCFRDGVFYEMSFRIHPRKTFWACPTAMICRLHRSGSMKS